MTKKSPTTELALKVLESNRNTFRNLKQVLEREMREEVERKLESARAEIDILIYKARASGAPITQICEAYGSTNRKTITDAIKRVSEQQGYDSPEDAIAHAMKENSNAILLDALEEAKTAWDEQEIRRYRPGVSEEESSVFNPVQKSNRPRGMHGYPDTGEIEEWIDYHANYSDQDWMGQMTTVTRPYTDINGNEWARGEA